MIKGYMMKAFWIKPNNEIRVTNTLHIDDVIKTPEWFGLKSDHIITTYKKYNEPMWHEGKARSEIMRALIQSGFIRVRYTSRLDFWTFEVNTLDKHTKELIWSFFNHEAISYNKFSDIHINTLKNNDDIVYKTNVQDVLKYAGLFEDNIFKQILENIN